MLFNPSRKKSQKGRVPFLSFPANLNQSHKGKTTSFTVFKTNKSTNAKSFSTSSPAQFHLGRWDLQNKVLLAIFLWQDEIHPYWCLSTSWAVEKLSLRERIFGLITCTKRKMCPYRHKVSSKYIYYNKSPNNTASTRRFGAGMTRYHFKEEIQFLSSTQQLLKQIYWWGQAVCKTRSS